MSALSTDPNFEVPPPRPGWAEIVLGTLVTLALLTAFTGLGMGLFFLLADFEDFKQTLWIILMAVGGLGVIALSFWAGGCVAAQFGKYRTKKLALFQGVGVWALTISVVLFSYIQMAPMATRLLGEMGLTAGAGAGVSVIVDELTKQNIAIVSDMKIFEGRVVTHLASTKKGSELAKHLRKEVVEEAEEQAKSLKQPQALKTIGTFANIAGCGFLLGFLTLVLAGAAAVLGALKNAVILEQTNPTHGH